MATTIVTTGQTLTSPTIVSGDALTVQTGGTVTGVNILSGGNATISGVENNGTIELGGVETLLAGTVTGDLILGLQQVLTGTSGVTMNNETIGNGGTVDIFNASNTFENSTILTGGLLAINGNTTNYDLTLAGGTINLESGKGNITGTLNFESGTLIESKIISSGYGDLATIVGFNANDTIELTAAVVGTGAIVTSGTAGSTTVVTVTSGTTVETFTFAGTGLNFVASTIAGGGELITLAGTTSSNTTTVASGQSLANEIVASATTLAVLAGGTVTSAQILSGGTANIAGVDTNLTLASGGTLAVSAGAVENNATILAGGVETFLGALTATGDQVYGLQQIVSANATTGVLLNNETIFSGGEVDIFYKTNTIENSTILTGGLLAINGNATGANMTLAGGTINMESGKANLTGTLAFTAGTLLESTVISAGSGDLATITGFNTNDVIELNAIGTGATLTSTTSGGNTVLTVAGGNLQGTIAESFTFAGTDYIFGMNTIAGGDIIALTPTVTVTDGQSLANETIFSGYTLDVLAGGTVTGAQILAGGAAIIAGTASNDVVVGTETVTGTASADIVQGTEIVSGTAHNVTIAGGLVELAAGAVLNGASFAGGTLAAAVGATVSGEIAGFAMGDVIDLAAIGTGATLTSATQGADAVITIAGGSAMGGTSEIFTIAGGAGEIFALSSISGGEAVTLVNPQITVTGNSTGDVVSASYVLNVQAGGIENAGTVLTGGTAEIYGTDIGSTIALGGTETVFAGGTASNDVIFGKQIVSGTVSGETVEAGGTVNLAAGTASNIVLSGGVLSAGAGTLAGGITLEAGGTLALGTGASEGAVISGLTAGGVIDLANIGTGAIITGLSTINGNEVMTISGGSNMGTLTETITIAGTGEYFTLAKDAAGTGETLTALAQLSSFTAGDLVVGMIGDDNDSAYYGDNQAAPIVLEEIDVKTGSIVGVMVLPQTSSTITSDGTTITESMISGEYGSSSEGILQLSGDGQSLVIAGYGVNAAQYNANAISQYGTAALAQTTSVEGGEYTAVARVIADISYNGTVDTSTALYDVFNTNNPRSVTTVDGKTFYIAGQGVKGDTTEGVFVAQDGASSATAIDTASDGRTVELYDGVLYMSQNSSLGTANIESFGGLPTGASTPTILSGLDLSVVLTAAQANSLNAGAVGTAVALSPEEYFFANATTLYVADGGQPKAGTVGDGGLQKWVLNTTTGQWTLAYTLSLGLNLVDNSSVSSNTSGTTGLIGLTGVLNADGTVTFYATNSTIGDLDQTYVYTITDVVSATTAASGESFTVVTTAATDTNVRGVSLAPSAVTDVTVSAGQTSAGLTVSTGATLTVQAGGSITGAVILSGGTAVVSGSDSGSLIVGSGTETVYGIATGDNVYGVQIVSGAVSDETVYYGATMQVANGGTATSITTGVNGVVEDAGTVSGIVMSGGVLTLDEAGASVSGVTLAGSATIAELTAGTSINGVINGFAFGDEIDLTQVGTGAVLTSAIVDGNTVETVTSGGVSQSFTLSGLYAPGVLGLSSDGGSGVMLGVVASTVTGSEEITSGEYGAAITVASGATLQVDAGATIAQDSVLAGGAATIDGVTSGDLVAGSMTLTSGAVASNETLNGGTLLVEAGATLGGTLVVANAATLEVGASATVAAVISGFTNGDVIELDGFTTGTVTSSTSGGNTIETVTSGGVSESFTFAGTSYNAGFVFSNGTLAAGVPTSAVISSGQSLANDTVVNGFTLDVLAGGTVTSPVVLSGGTANILGTETGAVVSSGGTLIVSSGAAETGATILAGGTETLIGAVTATGDQVYGLQQITAANAATGTTLNNETIFSGGEVDIFYKTNTLENSTILSGGLFAIDGNATGADITLAGGTIALESPKANLTGTLNFAGGTLIETAVVSAGYGDLASIVGFGAGDVIELAAYSGSATLGSTTNSSGNTIETVTSGTTSESFTFAGTSNFELVTLAGGGIELLVQTLAVGAGTTSTGTTIAGGTVLTVATGGTLSATVVQSGSTLSLGGTDSGTTLAGGSEIVTNGGTSYNVLVTGGGSQTVASGGTLVGATITNDSSEYLQSGATASNVIVGDPSNETIASGASQSDTTLTGGGELFVYGTADGVLIETGSTEFVYTGGTTSDTVIESGGTLVLNGGTATDTTLQNGGAIINESFAYVSGMTGTISGGTLVVNEGTTNVFSVRLDGDYSNDVVTVSAAADGKVELTLCFYPGTHIATPEGERLVEELREGDMVLTANGAMPVRWMGQSHVGMRFADKQRSLPVRIKAGALGDGLPVRDLLVSPDHAIFIGGVLAQASALVNGVNILREYNVPEFFTYYHVELDSHELLLAEGVQAESFVDNIDRMHFHNWDARTAPAQAIGELPYPRAKSARQLPLAVRRKLAIARSA